MNDENRITGAKQSNTGCLKAPAKTWLHSDDTIQDGIKYGVKVMPS